MSENCLNTRAQTEYGQGRVNFWIVPPEKEVALVVRGGELTNPK
jgi:hypothetical protein